MTPTPVPPAWLRDLLVDIEDAAMSVERAVHEGRNVPQAVAVLTARKRELIREVAERTGTP